MNIVERKSNDGKRIYYSIEWGRGAGERISTGIYTFSKPENQAQKNYNKEALVLLEQKRSQLVLNQQSIGTGYIPAHKFKANFLDYMEDFVKINSRKGNRHLSCGFKHFKKFLGKATLSPIDVTENLCIRFRQYLLDNLNGECPSNYFAAFKKIFKAATKEGYFRINPVFDVKAKENKNKKLKENLEVEEYLKLLATPHFNEEVRDAFIFCCYTGLRFCDVKTLNWEDIDKSTLTTKIIQSKTGEPLRITLHDTAQKILEKRKKLLPEWVNIGRVFDLPSADGSNKSLGQWCKNAGIGKHITWHCARLSFSILLQDKNVDTATVALLLGHTTTKYVLAVYKRVRPKDQSEAIAHLPMEIGQQEEIESTVVNY